MRLIELKRLLKQDKDRWGNQSTIRLSFFHPEFRLVRWKRYCEYFHSNKYMRPLYYITRWKYHMCCRKCGCDIPSKVKLGGGFQLLHAWGIVINSNTVIGQNCTIVTGTLIGKTNSGIPIIGDNVYIGGHSVIVGGIRIGDHATIGAGAIVVNDVPDNAVMICDKAHNIAKRSDKQ